MKQDKTRRLCLCLLEITVRHFRTDSCFRWFSFNAQQEVKIWEGVKKCDLQTHVVNLFLWTATARIHNFKQPTSAPPDQCVFVKVQQERQQRTVSVKMYDVGISWWCSCRWCMVESQYLHSKPVSWYMIWNLRPVSGLDPYFTENKHLHRKLV